MNRKQIYFKTLIFPFLVITAILLIGMITLGNSFWNKSLDTIIENWYHILSSLISIILGIEIFGKNLENKLKNKKRFWTSFKYALKISILFLISNIITYTIEKYEYFNGIGSYLFNTVDLIIIAILFYGIMIFLTSFIIGIIISKSKIEKKTNAKSYKIYA